MRDSALSDMLAGFTFDLVVDVLEGELHRWLAKGLWHGDEFVISGFPLHVGVWTIYDACFCGLDGSRGLLEAGPQAAAFGFVKEVCAGLGGISIFHRCSNGRMHVPCCSPGQNPRQAGWPGFAQHSS